MRTDEVITLITDNVDLVGIAAFGGAVLFFFKLAEYIHRAPEDQMSILKASIVYFGLFLGLPILGAGMSTIYLVNGSKMGGMLAFQVGLTSPAIVQGVFSLAANKAVKRRVKTPRGA